MNYESIQNGIPSFVQTDGIWGGNCSDLDTVFTYSAGVPISVTKSYTPNSIINEVYNNDKSGSWRQVQETGQIKMTGYNAKAVETSNYLYNEKKNAASLGWPWCMDGSWYGAQIKAVSHWDKVSDLEDLKAFYALPHYNEYVADDYAGDINSICASVVSDSYQALDALTTFAEVGDTLRLIKASLKAVRRPFRTFWDLAQGITTRRKMADTWLKLRYAIMPEIYTITDALQLLEDRKFIYKTSRSINKTQRVSQALIPVDAPSRYLYSNANRNVIFRGTGKAKFSSTNLRLTDQISFNPVITAWELVPYSFVLDWFINVGDVISSRSLMLADFASQRMFCYSVKEEIVNRTFYHDDYSNDFVRQYAAGDVVWNSGPLGGETLMREVTTKQYRRRLFTPTDVKLQFAPFLNWERWIDAYALSLGPISGYLRKLRK